VLVTGGAGFIGSHAVETLVAAGETVRVLDDFSTGRRAHLAACEDAIEIVTGDVRDRHLLAQAVQGCDRVLHLAAIASVTRSFLDPATTAAVNVDGTANLLAAARRAGVRNLVLASTCAVYGAAGYLPLSETTAPRPLSPYARSKLRGEELCRAAGTDGRLNATVLRFFNVYGPRQDPSSPYSGVIAIFMDRLVRGAICTVDGDGLQTRDFVYVDDVVSACRLALDGQALGAAPLNVGTGVETSVLQLLDALAAASGRQPEVAFTPAREGDVRRSQADCSRAARLLSFRATTPFADGIAATWDWYRSSLPGRTAVP
jgi:UDP-glucose 4-epimerase